MNTTRTHHCVFTLLASCLIFLLAACGSGGSTTGTATPTSGTPTQAITPTTVPVPPTQTSCPPAGTARAWVTANLTVGQNQNIVYVVNEFPTNSNTGTLKRYDLATGKKTEIIKMPKVSISEAALSSDGQWILFVSAIGQQNELQMVRMDGQGLQTLYCAANGRIQNVLWSTNQQTVLFSASAAPDGFAGIYLLNLANGALQLELKPNWSNIGASFSMPIAWLDNTRAYISFANFPIAPIDRLGILDTSRGPGQSISDLTTVYQDKLSASSNYPCWDTDSSYDGSTLFISQCRGLPAPNCSGSCLLGTREGPSTINTEPAAGGTQHTMLTSQTLGIAMVRAISPQSLLLAVENFSRNHPVDASQNGLWKVSSNGSGLTRLAAEGKGQSTTLNQYTQFPWSNVSRDGSMYAFETTNSGSVTYPYTYALLYGSLSGGAPTTFASISDGTQLSIVGWTTMSS
jgi:eukaryotic-like serine/threonine-protein kinase